MSMKSQLYNDKMTKRKDHMNNITPTRMAIDGAILERPLILLFCNMEEPRLN